VTLTLDLVFAVTQQKHNIDAVVKIRSYAMFFKALVFGAIAACAAAPVMADWNALSALQRDGALVSASAIDLDRHTVIGRLNAGTRLTPASLTKLITAAAALERCRASAQGLTSAEAAQRLEANGPNRLPAGKRRSRD